MKCKQILLLLCSASILWAQKSSEDDQFQEDYGKLLEQMGQNMVENYFDPLSGNLGAAYNGVWATGFPSREYIDLNPSVSLVGGFSYVRSSFESFDTEVTMEMTPAIANRLVEKIDVESMLDPRLPEEMRLEMASSLRSQVAASILKDDPKYKVRLFGPTIIGSQKDTVKLAWKRRTLTVDYEYELPSVGEVAEEKGLSVRELKDSGVELPDKTETVKGSEDVEIPSQEVSTGIFGIMNGLPIVPSMAPQLTLGSVFGTQAVLRYTPEVALESEDVDLGTIEYFGWSVQHDLSFWVQKWVDWNLLFMYAQQRVNAFDMFELSTEKWGLMFGESFDILGFWTLTPYMSWSYDRNSLRIDFSKGYQFMKTALENPKEEAPDVQIEYVTDWERQTSLGLIMNFFSIVEIQAEGSVGRYTNAFVRAAVGF